MMKSACFLAVLALCTAGAPPRISLVLNERLHKGSEDLTNGATVVAEKLGAYHDQAHKSASYAEACNLNSDRSKCVFPVAKGFDADYGTVDVKTTINRMARNGDITQYITPTSGDDAKSFHNAQDVLDKFPRKDMLSRTGAFLFQYEAESQGQNAEVVTFFLLVNDIEAPKFVGADKCDMGMNKGGKKNVIDAVSGSFNDRAISKCIDAITCTDNSGSFDKTCQDTQGNNQKCGKINYEGTLETRDQKASATVTCTDRAGLYGKNGESNKVVKHFHWNVQDTTPPKFVGLNAVPPYSEYLECKAWRKAGHRKNCKTVIEDKAIHWAEKQDTGSWGPYLAETPTPMTQDDCIKACEDNKDCAGWSYRYGNPKHVHYKKCFLLDSSHTKYAPADAKGDFHSGICKENLPVDWPRCVDGETTSPNTEDRATLGDWQSIVANKVGPINVDLKCADAWGNYVTAKQTYNVVDTTPPRLTIDTSISSVYTVPIVPTDTEGKNNAIDSSETFLQDEIKWDCENNANGESDDCTIDIRETGKDQKGLKFYMNVWDECRINMPKDGDAAGEWRPYGRFMNHEEHHDGNTWTNGASLQANWEEGSPNVKNCNKDFCNNVPGVYNRIFTAFDYEGLSTSVTVPVTLVDEQEPILRPNDCDNRVSVLTNGACINKIQAMSAHDVENMEFGGFKDHGAECRDYVDGILTPEVKVTGDVVDLTRVGTYVLTYSCTDYSKNTQTTTRQVLVFDNTPPTLYFGENQGQSYVVHELAAGKYTDAGVTYEDYNHNQMCTLYNDQCKCSQSRDHALAPTKNCPIMKVGDTVATASHYFEKSSCGNIPGSGNDAFESGSYVITPQRDGELVRRHAICYRSGFWKNPAKYNSGKIGPGKIFTIIAQDSNKEKSFSDARDRCENMMAGSRPLLKADLEQDDVTELSWLIPSQDSGYEAGKGKGFKFSPATKTQLTVTSQVFTDKKDRLTNWLCALIDTRHNDAPQDTQDYKNKRQDKFDKHNGARENFGTVGMWVITYVGTDKQGHQAFRHRTVEVVDNKIPVIRLVDPRFAQEKVLFSKGPVDGQWAKGKGYSNRASKFMAVSTSANGYFLCAIASAVAGVALLSFSSKKSQTMVPV
jgi:hypothetical protein